MSAFFPVHVDSTTRQILIAGQLTAEQQAGCDARATGAADSYHEQGGSTCCGSCT